MIKPLSTHKNKLQARAAGAVLPVEEDMD